VALFSQIPGRSDMLCMSRFRASGKEISIKIYMIYNSDFTSEYN